MSSSPASSIESALASGDRKPLEAALLELKLHTLDTGSFDDELFSNLLRMLKGDQLRASEYSWLVLRELTEGLDLLTEEQVAALSGELEELFDTAANALSAFVVVEAFGDMASTSSLERLLALRSRGDEERRALIPMGLSLVAENTPEPHLRERAVLSLKALAKSSSPRVQEEAKRYLAEVAARG